MGETPWDRVGHRGSSRTVLPRARRGRRSGHRGRRGDRPARRPAGDRPPRPARGGLSKSATKARIEPRRVRRNVDIPRFSSPPIPPRSAFVADLDTTPPRITTGAPPAPRRHPRITFRVEYAVSEPAREEPDLRPGRAACPFDRSATGVARGHSASR
ncbi:hypothetical protein AM609_10835 [Actinomyces sp. oral taxon 414]|nr:hypothetical protein AM609_10835 [Actinomyces sp. oral taxon 414]